MKKLYETITAKIVADLESGIRPSSMCWNGGNGIPRPLRANGEPYRGINTLLLWAAAAERGFTAPIWMTYKQAVRRESRMKGVTDGSMSSVQLCRRFPHAVPVTARCEAGMKAQDGNAASAFRRARRRSEGRTRVNSH